MEEENIRLKKAATTASVCLASILCLIKMIAGIMTGSLAVISSMIDNLADVFASTITLFAVRFASLPPSSSYKYGYGKVEAISALIQSAFVAGSGLFIMYEGVNRFINLKPLQATSMGLIVMIISLCSTLALIKFQKYVYKKTHSQAIRADSAHYAVDVVSNIGIIITLIVMDFFDMPWFDPLTAILVSAYLLFNAYKIARDAIDLLLDKELDKKIRAKARAIILQEQFVKGLHDFRSRDLITGYSFEFHLELDGNLTLSKAHEYADTIEHNLKKAFPDSQVIIHQDPYGLREDRLDNKITK